MTHSAELLTLLGGLEFEPARLKPGAARCLSAIAAAFESMLPALEGIVAEFDHYDKAMSEIGRGHEDYGGPRMTARAAIIIAKQCEDTVQHFKNRHMTQEGGAV